MRDPSDGVSAAQSDNHIVAIGPCEGVVAWRANNGRNQPVTDEGLCKGR